MNNRIVYTSKNWDHRLTKIDPELGIGVDGFPLYARLYTGIKPAENITMPEFATLTTKGFLEFFGKYAWDGASIPAKGFFKKVGFKNQIFRMRYPACEHDVACQLCSLGLMTWEMKQQFDDIFRKHCILAGVWKWVSEIAYKAILNHKPKPEPKDEVAELPTAGP